MKSFSGYKKQTIGDSEVLLAGGGSKALSDFLMSSVAANTYLPRNTNSEVLPLFSGSPSYLLGIESFTDGGTIKWLSTSDITVGYADSAYTVSSFSETSGGPYRYVWHSHSDNSAKLGYNSGIMFNPDGGWLKVTRLHVNSDSDVSNNGSTGSIIIGSSSGASIGIDANEIIARSGNSASTLYLLNEGGSLLCGASSSTFAGRIYTASNIYSTLGGSNSGVGALHLNNSDITGVNAISTNDVSDDWTESLAFKRNNGNWDSFRAKDGTFYFGVNNGTEYTAIHSGNYSSYALPLSGGTMTGELTINTGNVYFLTDSGRGKKHFYFKGKECDYGVMLLEHTSDVGSGGPGTQTATLKLLDARTNNISGAFEPTLYIHRSGATRVPDLFGCNVSSSRVFTIDSSGNVSNSGNLNTAGTIKLNGTAVSLSGHNHDSAYVKRGGDSVSGHYLFTGRVFGYNYGNQGSNVAAFMLDKPGLNYSGLGARGVNDEIYFCACDVNGGWVTSYKQKWRFNGGIYADSLNGLTPAYQTYDNNFILHTNEFNFIPDSYNLVVYFNYQSPSRNSSSTVLEYRMYNGKLGYTNVVAANFYTSSDKILKTNINSISNILPIVEFNWKENNKHSYGFIAQQLEKEYPELVSNGETKTVNYSAALSLYLAKLSNIVELNDNNTKAKIIEMERRIDKLENKILGGPSKVIDLFKYRIAV